MRSWTTLREAVVRHEAPTWGLVAVIYAGWLALTFHWHELPYWIVAPLGAWLCAWHMSLQHELMHGHPTRRAWLNDALAWPPLNLWLPYQIYREQHLRHHRAPYLADPLDDPESTYMLAADWVDARAGHRWLHRACNTLVGRMLLGPARAMAAFWLGQARRVPRDPAWRTWLGHAAGATLVMVWVCGVCRINIAFYIVGAVYPGTALILVRSLAEHRAAELPEERTAVVERAGLLGLLFLHNNLHAAHHAQPGVPWYRLPALWQRMRPFAARALIYHGYQDVAVRFAVCSVHAGPYPEALKRRPSHAAALNCNSS